MVTVDAPSIYRPAEDVITLSFSSRERQKRMARCLSRALSRFEKGFKLSLSSVYSSLSRVAESFRFAFHGFGTWVHIFARLPFFGRHQRR